MISSIPSRNSEQIRKSQKELINSLRAEIAKMRKPSKKPTSQAEPEERAKSKSTKRKNIGKLSNLFCSEHSKGSTRRKAKKIIKKS